jgi:serine/threonine-protein kinase
MGEVWRARDVVLARDVAVKVLRSEFTANPTFLARFRAEAQHSAGLMHPNIATLFDYGEVPPEQTADGELRAYLVMELVRGESLSALLRREHRLPVDRTLEVLRHSAAGLAAAHAADVVHRDVKPGNVLLADDGGVKLTDFGVAVSAASVPLTRTGEVIGTANYLSPEQARGLRATPASDVYALGLVGYECLAGHRAFEGDRPLDVALRQVSETPPPLPDDVPEPVRRLIEQAIAKDPTERFADGAALRAAIDDVIAGRPIGGPVAQPRTTVMPAVRAPETAAHRAPEPTTPRTPTPLPPFPPTRAFALPPGGPAGPLGELAGADDEPDSERRRRWPLALAALLTLLVVAGGTSAFLQFTGDRPAEPSAATTSAPPSTPAPSAPVVALVSLSTTDYVGRPVAEVQADLVERGLQVALQPLQTGDVPDGQVIALSPTGQVMPGTVVAVTHAVTPPPPPTPTPAPVPDATPTPEPAPAPAPTAEPTEDDEDDDERWTEDDWREWLEENRDDWPDDRDGGGRGG